MFIKKENWLRLVYISIPELKIDLAIISTQYGY